MLFLAYTRPDIIVDTLFLQSKTSAPHVSDLVAHNKVVKKAWLHSHRGLLYPRLQQPTCIVAFADAGGPTKKSSYAIEGRIIVRKEDTLVW